MIYLVLGGAASGKSAYAEQLCMRLAPTQKKLYLATMQPFGKEAEFRIARHHALRQGKGFTTLELYRQLTQFDETGYEVVLLECMSTLLSNEFFDNPDYEAEILKGIATIAEKTPHLVILSNEIFSDGIQYEELTQGYQQALAKLNQYLTGQADVVVEVVCGLQIVHKGKEWLDALE